MAEKRRYALGNQLDMEQILSEAQTRWLRPAEICEILRNHHMFFIGPEPPNKPSSGSLFLFDRKVLRYFRKDGHIWRKKKDGKTVKEAHEKLKAGSVDVLHCYYAHGEDNENFQRRSYWMLEEDYMHIVLVHYREVQGTKTNIDRTRNTEEGLHSSQIGSPLSSSYVRNHNHLHSQTTDSTSLNSGQTSEHEEAESANNYQESSRFHSFPVSQQYEDMRVKGEMDHGLFNSYFYSVPTNQDFILGAGDSEGADSNDAGFGLRSETPKQLSSTSWGEVSEPCTPESHGTHLIPSASSAQSAPVMFGQDFTDEFNSKMDGVNRPRCQDKWKTDHKLQTPVAYDQCIQFSEQKNHHPVLHHSSESFSLHPGQQICYPVRNDHKMQLQYDALGSVVNSDVNDDSAINGIDNHSSIAKYSPLENSETERLKKLDSFNRWMSSELGEVDESYLQTGSVINWDTVESENVVDDSSLSPQVHMDAYLLSTVLSQEQLFSIVDFSPSWAYTDSENKVLITGAFLTNQEDAANCRWSCMFGEMEVPAEVLADGVLRCIAPPHKIGRVPFYVTCSNRLACSEVREFEFRVKYPQDTDMEELHSSSTNDLLLHIRLGKFLSLGSVGQPDVSSVVEHSIISSKISLLMKEDEDEWLQMIKLTSEKECSAGIVKDQLLQRILKEKLHAWLLQKVNEDEKGPCVLDKDGQGVLHLAASLGYDWAIAPTIMAGVSINFRDVNGWSALHWAAFCGRERTVVALLQLGAAPGALTDPSPEFPAGRTPADLASSKGHKGIAGFLAETSLTAHLTALNVKDAKDGKIPPMKATQTVSERIATPTTDCNVPDASLKDSLAAVCNATQAAARIHQVFRVQSFQKKKLAEYCDDKSGMSDQRALSLISFKKTHRSGQHDEPVHTAAIRIQNKFRGWKGRKDFLLIRQRIVKLQAYVRGHQVRKQYKKIIWSVGIVEKAILRWRRKGTGLRGFRPDTHLEGSTTESGSSKGGKYDFLKEGRKQTEERLHKALARVNSMVRYPEARDQYRRLLTVVTEFQENKVVSDGITNTSEEVGDDIMINLNALLDDETFSTTS